MSFDSTFEFCLLRGPCDAAIFAADRTLYLGFDLQASRTGGYFISVQSDGGTTSRLPEGWSLTVAVDRLLLHDSDRRQWALFYQDKPLTEVNDWSTGLDFGDWLYFSRQSLPDISGPLAIGRGEQIRSFIEAGPEAWLRHRPMRGLDQFLPDPQRLLQPGRAIFQLAALLSPYVRSRLASADHWEIASLNHQAADLLALLLLRLAAPQQSLGVTALPEQLRAQWKRFCQNLGIAVGRAPRPAYTGRCQLASLVPELDQCTLGPLLADCQDEQLLPMIPNRLRGDFQPRN